MSKLDAAAITRLLAGKSVSKTIYALVTPETEAADQCLTQGRDLAARIAGLMAKPALQGDQAAVEAAITKLLNDEYAPRRDMFREAWTQKQDRMHEEFFTQWRQWTAPIITHDPSFCYAYPTAGASEALREAINAYAARCHQAGQEPRLHIFAGEYEGYAAYAKAAGITLVTHDRANWQSAVQAMRAGEEFYLSHPSAIDGMVWDKVDDFMHAMDRQQGARLMLDVTYVGAVARDFTIDARHASVQAIFFSLSKPFGVYYHRIGGMIARAGADGGEPYPGLFGNKWFKNLYALQLGTELMQRHAVQELAAKYRPLQERATAEAAAALGLDLKPCDVMLLASAKPSTEPSDAERYLQRDAASATNIRVCLTPRMAAMLGTAASLEVQARYYEALPTAPAASVPNSPRPN